MRLKKIPATLLSLLIALVALSTTVRAEDDTEPEYDVTARVVRISLLKGDVTVRRQGNTEWETAKLNLPLVEGDTLTTGSDARLELQIDARNFARVGPDSVLKIVTLRNDGIALSLSRGTAIVRLARFDRDREFFEVDAPKTTVAMEKKGLYRLDVEQTGRVQITVRDDGRARIYSETSGFLVRDGRTATLMYQEKEEGEWQFASAPLKDSLDDWVISREAYLATRLRYDDRARYYDSDIWGAEELDAYGDWTYVNDYGWMWRPHITVINNYNNWAPYRVGDWVWVPPYGWTWVGLEPWGWAPYHYGRWVFYNNYWAWCPRPFNHRRSWWRPALVAFVSINFDFGNHYCWYPLSYHQRDPRSRHYGRDRDRFRSMRPDELARLRRADPNHFRAVSSQSARDFGRNGHSQPVAGEIARRALNLDPVAGDIPVRPAVDGSGFRTGDRQAARAARPASGTVLNERPTGAASRQPGVALDNELRRARVWNGREPANTNSGSGTSDATGAIMRPARPPREPAVRENNNDPTPTDSVPVERPARPAREAGTRPRGNEGSSGETPTVERPVRAGREAPPVRDNPPARETPIDRSDGGRPTEMSRPARPEKSEAPARREPVEAPRQQERPPAPRYEPPARHDPPPQRSEPAPRHEPPARHDPPPQRSEPAPRHDPPARSDPPPQRSDPPARSDPPPQRSEPAPERPSNAENKAESKRGNR